MSHAARERKNETNKQRCTLSNVITLHNLLGDELPQEIKSMAVESFDLSTRARLDHPRQLRPVRVLQAQHQLIT